MHPRGGAKRRARTRKELQAQLGKEPYASYERETGMAANPHLVLAFFPSEETADGAAEGLRAWAKTSERIEIEGVGVLVEGDKGKIGGQKRGAHRRSTGAG